MYYGFGAEGPTGEDCAIPLAERAAISMVPAPFGRAAGAAEHVTSLSASVRCRAVY